MFRPPPRSTLLTHTFPTRRSSDRLSGRIEVRPLAGGGRRARPGGLRFGAGGLRQVLQLLRGALYPRGGIFSPGGSGVGRGAPPGGGRRAGAHPAGAERERLPRRSTGERRGQQRDRQSVV